MTNSSDPTLETVRKLSCWFGSVDPEPLKGGITNKNYVVSDRGRKFVVRTGGDILVHGIVRTSELQASKAAHAAGIAPRVVHWEPGVMVLDYIEGHTFTPEDVRNPEISIASSIFSAGVIRMSRALRGPAPMFWPFHVIRDYGHTLRDGESRYVPLLADLIARSEALEKALGPIDVVFGHNDLLAANIRDDGTKLWLLDWEYAGFNSPLFDLGGLASNSDLPADQNLELLTRYFGRAPDAALLTRASAMLAASLLREALWAMVSELYSKVDFDYAAYTSENLARFEAAWTRFQSLECS